MKYEALLNELLRLKGGNPATGPSKLTVVADPPLASKLASPAVASVVNDDPRHLSEAFSPDIPKGEIDPVDGKPPKPPTKLATGPLPFVLIQDRARSTPASRHGPTLRARRRRYTAGAR